MSVTGIGFPVLTRRRDLTDAGVRVVEERQVGDPRSELSAKVWETLLWQVGALGPFAPLACVVYEPASWAASAKIRFEMVAWDVDRIYENLPGGLGSWITVTENGTGDYTVDFGGTARGSDLQFHPVTIVAAAAQPIGLDGTPAPVNVFATPVQIVTPSSVRFRFRLGVSTLVHSPFVLIVWGGA